LPFDIHNLSAIGYDPQDLQYSQTLCERLKETFKAMQDPNYKVPELLPLKFDLEKIVSDPVKFVELLKQHLQLIQSNNNYASYQPNITEVYDDPLMSVLVGANQNRELVASFPVWKRYSPSPWWRLRTGDDSATVRKIRSTLWQQVRRNAHDHWQFCSYSPAVYWFSMYAFSPHISRS
jgi:hypothetical protein